jgi:cysteine desulfurase
MARAPVYLDYHATTPVDPRVLDAMLPYFTQDFGNAASSTHAWGWRARDAVEAARREVAALIGAQPREIVFTGGATESNNMAIHGVTTTAPSSRRHIIVSAIEHKSVLEPAQHLTAGGWRVTVAPVQRTEATGLRKPCWSGAWRALNWAFRSASLMGSTVLFMVVR